MNFPKDANAGDIFSPGPEGPLFGYVNGEWVPFGDNGPPLGVQLLDRTTGKIYERTVDGWIVMNPPSEWHQATLSEK